jgi:hypothetical protein
MQTQERQTLDALETLWMFLMAMAGEGMRTNVRG